MTSSDPSNPQKSPMEIEREQLEREKLEKAKLSSESPKTESEKKSESQLPPPPPPREHHDLLDYIKQNQRDTVAYIVLVIGIILMLFQFPLGSLLVGIVAGLYFSKEIVTLFQKTTTNLGEEIITKRLVLGGVIIALIIAAPFLFLGAAVTVAIIELFAKNNTF